MAVGEVYVVQLTLRAEQMEGETVRPDYVAAQLANRAAAPLKLTHGTKRFWVEAEIGEVTVEEAEE